MYNGRRYGAPKNLVLKIQTTMTFKLLLRQEGKAFEAAPAEPAAGTICPMGDFQGLFWRVSGVHSYVVRFITKYESLTVLCNDF